MIATHNSGTGERGGGLLSLLLTPFVRCQSKTLVEQYKSGTRLFDIRDGTQKNKAENEKSLLLKYDYCWRECP